MKSASRTNNAKSLLNNFNDMKTIPAVAARLISMIDDDQNTLQDFEKVIKVDPILVLRLLKLVNSAYFSLRTKIKNISEAVAYLGMENLRNLIVVDALKNLFSKNSGSDYFSRSQLWLHCSANSICCQMISERIFTQKGEDAFLCGILHDVGLIVEDHVIPEKFNEFCRTYDPEKEIVIDYEASITGTDHPTLGGLIAKEWGLNPEIQEAVKFHHKSLDAVEPGSLPGILQIAEYLVTRIDYGMSPEVKVNLSSPPLLVHMKNNITGYRAIVDDLPSEIQKAKELYSLEDNSNE